MNASTSARSPEPRELEPLLLAQAKSGDRDAWSCLVRLYQDRVFRLLRRVLVTRCNAAEIEELAQDTFVRVFRALPGFDLGGPARLSSWILTIATRLAIDRLRRSRPVHVALSTIADLPGGLDADAGMHREGIANAIAVALAELPDEHRIAFVLREYHAMDYAEIAHTLRISPGTVASRLSRARTGLRRALEKDYG